MATSLTQAITSKYIGTANILRPSGSLPEVYIYVEGLDDVSFWNACVRPYSDSYRFRITQIKRVDGGLAEGKRDLIETIGIDTLGKYKMIAIDSDYDWIIDTYRTSSSSPSYSHDIRTNPYILHTYLYSIENYKCHPACVQDMVVKLSNVVPGIDINHYFETYSSALSELFLIHLVSVDLCDGIYNLKDFRTDADRVNLSLNPTAVTSGSIGYIKNRLTTLERYALAHQKEITAYKAKLISLGFVPENYYLLFQGHIVANTFVKKQIPKIIIELRSQRVAEIRTEGTQRQQSQRLSQFENITGIRSGKTQGTIAKDLVSRLNQLINDCTDVTRVPIGYNRIANDLAQLFPRK